MRCGVDATHSFTTETYVYVNRFLMSDGFWAAHARAVQRSGAPLVRLQMDRCDRRSQFSASRRFDALPRGWPSPASGPRSRPPPGPPGPPPSPPAENAGEPMDVDASPAAPESPPADNESGVPRHLSFLRPPRAHIDGLLGPLPDSDFGLYCSEDLSSLAPEAEDVEQEEPDPPGWSPPHVQRHRLRKYDWDRNPMLERIHALSVDHIVNRSLVAEHTERVLRRLRDPSLGAPALRDEAAECLPLNTFDFRTYVAETVPRTRTSEGFPLKTITLSHKNIGFLACTKIVVCFTANTTIDHVVTESLGVDIVGKAGTRTEHVDYLPPRRWLQNIVMTPEYSRQLLSFHDQMANDVKCQVLYWAQQRRFCSIFQTLSRAFVAGKVLEWTPRAGVGADSNPQRRWIHPGFWLTNSEEVLWVCDVDLGHVKDSRKRALWKFDAPSKRMRRHMKKLCEHFTETERPALTPAPMLQAHKWSSYGDWQSETGRRRVWVDFSSLLQGWDIFCPDVWLGGVLYKHEPWMVRNECVNSAPGACKRPRTGQRAREGARPFPAQPRGVATGRCGVRGDVRRPA